MDNKIGDAVPLTGQVTATEGTTGPGVAAVRGARNCVFTGCTQDNSTIAALSNTTLCHVRFRMN